jgi:hypothetical protein
MRGRPIEERIALAMPAPSLRAALAALARLPPGSQLHRRLLTRPAVRTLDANSRGDFDFGLLVYDRDVELQLLGSVAGALGLADSYRGHSGVRQLWSDYRRGIEGL